MAEQSSNWDRLEGRFALIHQDMDDMRRQIAALDQKFDRKLDDLHVEMSKQFRWMMGTMVMLFATMLTVGAGIITALLTNPT
jgi:hypothetical protein